MEVRKTNLSIFNFKMKKLIKRGVLFLIITGIVSLILGLLSVFFSKNGAMVWNHSEQSELKMKNLKDQELQKYLGKIGTETLLAYGVYQIEADGLDLFEYVKGDKDSIMGLPIKKILNYLQQLK